MSKGKIVVLSIASIIGFILLVFLLTYGGLYWKKFFGPKYESVNRQVFEETKSYVHGKNEDLAKYFEEYQKADSPKDKEIIQEFVKLRFSEFKAENVNSPRLRQFLISMRGY
jgi:cell shape-determining protein MreC